MALALANVGADIVIAELKADTGTKTAAKIEAMGRRGRFVETDVTDVASVGDLVDAVLEEFGKIDILVNNAGIVKWGKAEDVGLEDWHRVLGVNLHGMFVCCQAAGRTMLERGGGSIINIASMSGLVVNVPQCQVAYNSSKAAVIHLTRSLAVEWAPCGIRVNSISPGYMDTPLSAPLLKDPDYGPVWMKRIPMGRPGRPEELGPTVVYLASGASSYVTGSNIVVDGGYTAE